jgi:hypothetical protein
MEEIYREHIVRSGAQRVPDSNEWKPIAQVNWSEGGKERVKLWMEWHFKRNFPTEKEAEMEGRSFPAKWIDNGEPFLSTPRNLKNPTNIKRPKRN